MKRLACIAILVMAAQAWAQEGLKIAKPALPNDGVYGGLHVLRDATSLVGGSGVNSPLVGRCLIGRDATAFEWCGLFWMDNFANTGENVALYAQAQKRGWGPTWAQVVELNDTTGNDRAAVVQELDLMVNGPDSGNRVGIDLVLGDARQARGLSATPQVGGSVGLRIQAQGLTPQAKWTRGIWLRSNYVIGIDTSDANMEGAAVRLGAGQKLAFEGTGQITLHYDPAGIGSFVFSNGATRLMRLDAAGNLQVRGQFLGGLQ